MKTLFAIVILGVVLYNVHAAPKPAPFDGDQNETTSNTDNENQGTVNQESEDQQLSPQQLGRLARLNGNFFQLYGELNRKNGDLDAITGNRLNFHGGLVELLANEHTLRSISHYIQMGQDYHYDEAKKKSGRDAEIEQELGDLFGKLSSKFSNVADLENDQAQLKGDQLKAEGKIHKLADQEADLKGQETFNQLEISEIEEDQIKVENSAHPIIFRIMELEDEQRNNEKAPVAAAPVDAASAPEASPSSQ